MSFSSPLSSSKRRLSIGSFANVLTRSPSNTSLSLSPSPGGSSKKKFGINRLKKKQRKLPNLAELIRDKDFDTISEILRDPKFSKQQKRGGSGDSSFSSSNPWFDAEYSITGENCLHRLLKARPPARLVSLMLERLVEYGIEDPELSIDDLGQTPLHHAVTHCCDPQVIAMLVGNANGRMSARAQDQAGRVPLHGAMRPYKLFDEESVDTQDLLLLENHPELRRIVRTNVSILVEACPGSLFLPDDKKKIPLNLARSLVFDQDFPRWAYQLAELLVQDHMEQLQQRDNTKAARNRKPVEVIEMLTSTPDSSSCFQTELDVSALTMAC